MRLTERQLIMSKIVLIDGHSILNRAFFGLPDLTNAEGLHTNAIYGFLNIMFKILEEEKPEYLTVAFDVHAPTFRHKMFEAYKGTRKPMAEELRQQVPLMKEVLHAMGIRTIEQEGLEADDLLGTLSKRCERMGMEVVIISGDRDLLQLATDHVEIRIPKTKRTGTEIENYYAVDVKEKYQVTPTEFIDVKALMGDTSDNIPGVPGVGEKTATKIIVEYGSIENAYKHASELKPPRASKNLVEYWDQAQMSKVLATIDVDADFAYELEEAKLGNLYTEEAYVYFQRLQFKNLLNRFDVQSENSIEDAFVIAVGKEEIQKIFAEAEKAQTVGAVLYKDTRNVLPLFAENAEIGGIGISFGKEKIYCIPAGNGYSMEELLEALVHVAKHAGRFVVFDLKSSLPYLKGLEGAAEEKCFDSIVAAYLLNPLKNDYGFEDVAQEHLGLMIDPKTELEKMVCYEAYAAFASSEVLEEKLKKEEMWKLFTEIEMPLVFTLFHMEQNGVRVEAEELKSYGEQLGGKIVQLEKEIYELAGEEFNINSPKQLGVVLFEHLSLPNGKKTKTGYSTAADVLDKLAPDYPIVAKILEYRQLAKLKSTYADGLAVFIHEDDHRIHGKFNQTVTATGRISSTEPNLQNIPARVELGRLIRKVFVPEEGYVFVDADYSQIELRVLAHIADDENMKRAFIEDRDIHTATAAQVFGLPEAMVTPELRRRAKAVNFGIVYGIGEYSLSQDIGVSFREAKNYIENYFRTYSGVKKYMDGIIESAKEKGYVETMFARRRYVPDINAKNKQLQAFASRVCRNTPIQGTAADLIKLAMVRVFDRLEKSGTGARLILQIHDELIIEAPVEKEKEISEMLKYEMEHAANLSVPLLADVNAGKTWYESK